MQRRRHIHACAKLRHPRVRMDGGIARAAGEGIARFEQAVAEARRKPWGQRSFEGQPGAERALRRTSRCSWAAAHCRCGCGGRARPPRARRATRRLDGRRDFFLRMGAYAGGRLPRPAMTRMEGKRNIMCMGSTASEFVTVGSRNQLLATWLQAERVEHNLRCSAKSHSQDTLDTAEPAPLSKRASWKGTIDEEAANRAPHAAIGAVLRIEYGGAEPGRDGLLARA